MEEAFCWYCEQNPRPTVSHAATKFGINYEQLRGALILHGQCPEPLHGGKPGEPKRAREPRPLGRPAVPRLDELRQAFLVEYAKRHDNRLTTRLLGISRTTLGRVLRGERGLGPAALDLLDRLMAE